MRGITTFGREDIPDEHRDPAIEQMQRSHEQINNALADDLEHRPIYDRNKAHLFAAERD
jgi:hypothetical protein